MKRGRESQEATIARKIREGRGLGELTAYKPWLDIRDVPSRGRSHIVLSATVGREHHLLSDLEELVCLHADYSPHVIDIREQFPLFPRAETAAIAADMGIKPSSHYGVADVLTEDFVLTLSGVSKKFVARQVKYAIDLDDPIVRQKLELQRRYFERRGIDWKIITERDLSPTVTRNLKWLRRGAVESFSEADVNHFKSMIGKAKGSLTLSQWLRRTGDDLGFSRERAVLLFQRLVWCHAIELNIHTPIELTALLSTLQLRLPSVENTHAKTA